MSKLPHTIAASLSTMLWMPLRNSGRSCTPSWRPSRTWRTPWCAKNRRRWSRRPYKNNRWPCRKSGTRSTRPNRKWIK
nr:unnamed protein product [Callosobruchus chinensis]